MPNYCEDCKHKIDAKSPRYWTCIKAPLIETNFVSREMRVQEPYFFCRHVNTDGQCPNFEREENVNKD